LTARPAGFPLSPVVSAFLFMAIFAGFQGGRYFMSNRLQELGIACAGAVFVLGAIGSLSMIHQREWTRWVYTPVLLIGGIMVTWACVFAFKYDESVLFSIFASREFLLGMTGPALYLVVRAGYPIATAEKVIWAALLALLINYLFWYNTMDLREAFFSSDHTISNLVTYDPWRGFRLKPPTFAMMISILSGTLLLAQRRGALSMLFGLVLVGTAGFIWSIVLFRSTLATMILAIGLYVVFLGGLWRLRLLVLAIPFGIIALPTVIVVALGHFAEADGGSLRLGQYQVALANVPSNLLFGAGEDNAYGKSYQDLWGKLFFPSDLGIIGMLFKYGLLGAMLYLYMHFTIVVRLWKADQAVLEADGKRHPIIWAILVFFVAQTLNLPLNPGLAFAPGITAGTLALAWSALQHRRIAGELERGPIAQMRPTEPDADPDREAAPIPAT